MNELDIAIHDQTIKAAFTKLRAAEIAESNAKSRLAETEAIESLNIAEARRDQAAAWAKIEEAMKATGEFEVTLPGGECDYRIGYQQGRESVKVIDPGAVPDEMCRIERKPELKKIGDMLRNGGPCNWARLERGEPKLTWKTVKMEVPV